MRTVAVGRPHACPVGMPPGPGARETAARAEKLPDAGARTAAGFCGPVWAGRRMGILAIITGALAAAMGGLLTLPFRTAITCTCARLVRDGVLPQPPLRTAMGVQARRLFGHRAPGPGAALPPAWPWARRLLSSPRLCGRTAPSPAPASAPRHLCRAAGGDWPTLGRICPRGGAMWQGRRGEPHRPEIGPPAAPGGGLRAWAITGQGAALRALRGMCPARGRKSGHFSRVAAPTGGLARRGTRQGRPGGPTLAQNAPPERLRGGGATPCRGATMSSRICFLY